MSVEKSGTIGSNRSLISELLARTKAGGTSGFDLSGLLGAGDTGKNLPGKDAALAGLFDVLDSDKSGSISDDEFSSLSSQYASGNMSLLLALQDVGLDARVDKFMQTADTDASGGLSIDELTATARKPGATGDDGKLASLVKGLDSDGDGELSATEIKAGLRPPRPTHSFAWHELTGNADDKARDKAAQEPSAFAKGVSAAYSAAVSFAGTAALMAI